MATSEKAWSPGAMRAAKIIEELIASVANLPNDFVSVRRRQESMADAISRETADKELYEALEAVSHFPDANIGADWKPVFRRVKDVLAKAKGGR